MKWLLVILVLMFSGLQYRLWIGDGSYAEKAYLEREIKKQQAENEYLLERNRLLAVEVEDLKNGYDTIEERARHDLGMVKEGETFFMMQSEDE